MIKENHDKAQGDAWKAAGQAAVELAVFGAILIFILGTIIRSSVGNSYAQNQNYKAMRMALLASWNGSKTLNFSTGTDPNAPSPNISRNTASILFVEDRISPDFNKYGGMDRNPFIAQGSGSFSYSLMYPLDAGEVSANLPIMDIFINGQHFPLTTASYVKSKTIQPQSCGANAKAQSAFAIQTTCLAGCTQPPASSAYLTCIQNCQAVADQQCIVNQCLRNQREWSGGFITESQLDNVIPATSIGNGTDTELAGNASTIFNALNAAGVFSNVTWSQGAAAGSVDPDAKGYLNSAVVASTDGLILLLDQTFPTMSQASKDQLQNILQGNRVQYKLFYSPAVNGAQVQSPAFTVDAPSCPSHPCKDKELSADRTIGHLTGSDLMFDLQRTDDASRVIPQNLRPYVAWEWTATAATSESLIGLDSANNQYPNYDIDGRLKEVTIYSIYQDPTTGFPTVDYEDFQGGDIDSSWDLNSCTSKPGLQAATEIFTFTQNGTYLQIKEGKIYNPETGQEVRSVNMRNSIDIVQRTIQLSNNTGRFCTPGIMQPPAMVQNCTSPTSCTPSSDPNPVEICVTGTGNNNCFNGQNIAMTCYDTSSNKIYVRSRLEDRRGNNWMTNASGQLKVK